jgi:hypothetical protein
MLLALVAGSAFAQQFTWSYQAGAVLSPDPASTYANVSVSNPSVVRDIFNNQYVMAFETKTTTVDANCPNGVWDIGFATSPDGITWTMQTTPAIAPNPASNNYYSCVAAHPSLIYRSTNPAAVPTMFLYFKAEGWAGANKGIGVAFIKFRSSGAPYVRNLYAAPALVPSSGQTFATPHVIRQGSNYRMMVQEYPDILEYTSNSGTSFTTAGVTRFGLSTYQQPIVSWVDDEFYNPAYVCDDDPIGSFDLRVFPGARDTNAGTVLSGAWSTAVAHRSIFSYVLNTTPEVTWANNTEWRHWDVLGLTTGDYLIYFDEKDVSGNNFIRLGGTDLTWNAADIRTRFCP